MVTTRRPASKSTRSRSTSRKADDGLISRTGRTIRDRPYVSAAIATGAVTAVAAAAAGAFFFSRRDASATTGEDSSEGLTTRIKDGVSEAASKAKGMARQWMGGDGKDQADIAEEALTLKSTGKRARHPADPAVEQQTKAGAVAY